MFDPDLDYLIEKRLSFSLEGDDRLAASILRKTLKTHDKSRIFYLDIGASHPILGSNTCFFYELGFFGLCIDALPKYSSSFASLRPRDLFVNALVANEDSRTYLFTEYLNDSASSAEPVTQSQYDKKFEIKKQTCIQSRSVPSLLSELQAGLLGSSIPLVNIDIEGLESEVLSSLLSSGVQVDLFVMEEKGLNLDEVSKTSLYSATLDQAGYKLVARTLLNSFYINRTSLSFQFLPACMR